MKAPNRGIFMIFLLVLLLVAVLLVHPVAVARADFDPKANTPPPTQIRSFADLPPGLAPAVARAMQDDLSVAYGLSKTGANFQADKPAHGMHFTFTPAGLQVRGPNGARGWGMALSKWGCAGGA